jgi:hypothetical protein
MVVQWAVPLNGNTLSNLTALGPALTYWRESVVGTHLVAPSHSSVGPGQYAQFRVRLDGLSVGNRYNYTIGWLQPPPNVTGVPTSPAEFAVYVVVIIVPGITALPFLHHSLDRFWRRW